MNQNSPNATKTNERLEKRSKPHHLRKRIALLFTIGVFVLLAAIGGTLYLLYGRDSEDDAVPEVSKIISHGDSSFSAAAGGSIAVVMGSLEDLVLDVTMQVDIDGDVTSAQLDSLFQMEAYVKDQDNTKRSTKSKVTIPSAEIHVSQGTNEVTISGVRVTLDLTGQSCDQSSLCLEISPKSDDGSAAQETVCSPIEACTSQVTVQEIRLTLAEMSITMGKVERIHESVTVVTGTHTASITGNLASIFEVAVFFAANEFGQAPSQKVKAVLPSSGTLTVEPKIDVTIDDVSVDYDTSNMSCNDFSHVCVGISSSDTDLWFLADESVSIQCALMASCQHQLNGNIILASSNDQAFAVDMGLDLTFELDVNIVTERDTALFSDAISSLFNIQVYIASDGRGSSSFMKVDAVATNDRTVHVCADCSTGRMNTLHSGYSLFNLGCHEYGYACVDVTPVVGSNWAWAEGATSTACIEFDRCQVSIDEATANIIPDGGTFDFIMGVIRTYNFSFTLEIGDINTGKMVGLKHKLFRISASLRSQDLLEEERASPWLSDADAVISAENDDVTIGPSGAVTFTENRVTLNASAMTCEEYDLFCWTVNPANGSNWYWYGAGQGVSLCVPMTSCRNTYKFFFSNNPLSWYDASAECSTMGGTMAFFKSVDDFERFKYLYWKNRQQGEFWFGANDENTEGEWVYEDGSPLTLDFWNSGEPSSPGEHCAILLAILKWNDYTCTGARNYVCQYPSSCFPDFTCDNGNCISGEWECDLYDDCGDNSDETHCPCFSNYACHDGSCRRPEMVCNVNNDCPDGEDETNCYFIPFSDCFPDFPCSPDGPCIRSDWRCDTYGDCANMEDELHCPCLGYVCNEGKCVPDNWICDGLTDCAGGDDERNCADICPGYLCDTNGPCIPHSWVCNGPVDCTDASDEINCPP